VQCMRRRPRQVMTRQTWSGTPTPISPFILVIQRTATFMNTFLLTSRTPLLPQSHKLDMLSRNRNKYLKRIINISIAPSGGTCLPPANLKWLSVGFQNSLCDLERVHHNVIKLSYKFFDSIRQEKEICI